MKKILAIVIVLIVAYCFITVANDRAEKINNGEMVLVNQNQMDR